MKKLLGILVLNLSLTSCSGPQDGVLSSLIVFVAYVSVFACVGLIVLILKPFTNLWDNDRAVTFDRENSSHSWIFKSYPKYKGTYIAVPGPKKEKDRFWKSFNKKYGSKNY